MLLKSRCLSNSLLPIFNNKLSIKQQIVIVKYFVCEENLKLENQTTIPLKNILFQTLPPCSLY